MRALKMFPAVLALSLLAAPAFAKGNDSGDGKAHAAAKARPNAKQREQRQIAAMKKAGIDEARARRVVAVRQHYGQERRPVVAEMRTHRQKMRELAKANRTKDSAYAREKEAVERGRAKLEEIGSRQKDEVAKILTPAERAKIKKAHEGRKAHKHQNPKKSG
jgi:Spy/CpxP family protein refolding chaperone